MSVAGAIAYRFLQQNAESQVEHQGRLMIAAALAMRTYTDKQIDPLLMWRAFHSERFIAQTIPFYSATELFNYLRVTYPNYAYNPRVACRVILDSDGPRRRPHPALPPYRIATLSPKGARALSKT
jgi:hypothetical protein